MRINSFFYDLKLKISLFLRTKNYKTLLYSTREDLIHNLSIFKKLNLKYDNLLEFYDVNRKFNYLAFGALKEFYKKKSIKILEIGTFDGAFANFLGNKFKNSKIYTIDLQDNDLNFIHSYGRSNKKELKKFLNKRKKNLSLPNIFFYQAKSQIFLKKFKNYFDIIWVDGDHKDPVVSQDILNAYLAVKKEGFVLIDDIASKSNKGNPNKLRTNYESSLQMGEGSHYDPMYSLNYLKKNRKLKFYLLNKLIRPYNFIWNTKIGIFRK